MFFSMIIPHLLLFTRVGVGQFIMDAVIFSLFFCSFNVVLNGNKVKAWAGGGLQKRVSRESSGITTNGIPA